MPKLLYAILSTASLLSQKHHFGLRFCLFLSCSYAGSFSSHHFTQYGRSKACILSESNTFSIN